MAFGYREIAENAPISDQAPLIIGPESLSDEQRQYINAYVVGKSLRAASQATKINRFYHHMWMDDPAYAALFSQVRAYIRGVDAEGIEKRATKGWAEPLVYQGKKTGESIRRYSDTLALQWMKAYFPEWRDGAQIQVGPTKISFEIIQGEQTGLKADDTLIISTDVQQGSIDSNAKKLPDTE